jgi:galactokinase
MTQLTNDALKDRFAKIYGEGGKIHVIRAPGRVNLIGEHTDYNDGFVFPVAIESEVKILCRTRKDGLAKIVSTVFPSETVEFSLQKKIEPGKPIWGNYARGVAAEMIAAGIPLSGMDALITNSLPVGGGLSSSAALEIAVAKAMLLLAGLKMDENRLAVICQRAEQVFAGVPVGIMDQTAVAASRAGHAMLLDCRTLSKDFVPLLEKDLRLVVANSMVKHDLSTGEYSMRRRQCEEGVNIIKRRHSNVKALRDVTPEQLESARGDMSELIYRRCRHVITENARTLQMAEKLRTQFYDDAGELMMQSHNSLRDDFEVSIPELDFLVQESIKIKGVYGARMTGGGFGGCIVALVQPRSIEWLSEHLYKVYTDKFGRQPSVLATAAMAGASVLE